MNNKEKPIFLNSPSSDKHGGGKSSNIEDKGEISPKAAEILKDQVEGIVEGGKPFARLDITVDNRGVESVVKTKRDGEVVKIKVKSDD